MPGYILPCSPLPWCPYKKCGNSEGTAKSGTHGAVLLFRLVLARHTTFLGLGDGCSRASLCVLPIDKPGRFARSYTRQFWRCSLLLSRIKWSASCVFMGTACDSFRVRPATLSIPKTAMIGLSFCCAGIAASRGILRIRSHTLSRAWRLLCVVAYWMFLTFKLE